MNYPYNRGAFKPQNGQNQNREMTGKLWPNVKSQHPKAPQFTGVCTIQGVQYFISAWVNHDPQRGDVISLKMEPKQEARRNSFQNGGGYNGYTQPQQPQGYVPQQQNRYIAQPPRNGFQQQQPQPYPRPAPAPNYYPSEVEPPVPNGPKDYGSEPFDDENPFS